MLWTIFVILLVMWALGLVTSYTHGWIHSYPIGHCPGDASGQSGSGAKSLVALSAFDEGKDFMRINPITLVGIALIVLGIVAFAYKGIT